MSQQKLLAVLKDRVRDIDERSRVPDYQDQLVESLAQIVVLERGAPRIGDTDKQARWRQDTGPRGVSRQRGLAPDMR